MLLSWDPLKTELFSRLLNIKVVNWAYFGTSAYDNREDMGDLQCCRLNMR